MAESVPTMTNLREAATKFMLTCAEALATGNLNWSIATDKLESVLQSVVEEAVRDKVVEMCEGENCFVANKEQEARSAGKAEGLELGAKMAEDWLWFHGGAPMPVSNNFRNALAAHIRGLKA